MNCANKLRDIKNMRSKKLFTVFIVKDLFVLMGIR